MIVSTLLVLLAFPVVMIQYLKSDTLSAVYFMMFATGICLKMISFHHVVYDNRNLMKRISKLNK
jgi:heme/copper-type cytochrome/quinol oxidase subunit 4